MVLEKALVDEMERIGRERMPCEAAGILLPFPWRNQQVIELPNRSKTPQDHFEMHGDDIALALERFLDDYPDPSVWKQVVIWHTHPGGNIGPSKYDMESKIDDLRYLVVTLLKDGGALATWF